jgi:hypothetical protein
VAVGHEMEDSRSRNLRGVQPSFAMGQMQPGGGVVNLRNHIDQPLFAAANQSQLTHISLPPHSQLTRNSLTPLRVPSRSSPPELLAYSIAIPPTRPPLETTEAPLDENVSAPKASRALLIGHRHPQPHLAAPRSHACSRVSGHRL